MAVASAAGCSVAEPLPDTDSVDWTLSCQLPRRPKLDLQVKSASRPPGNETGIRYLLKRKNYDDLIPTNLLAPPSGLAGGGRLGPPAPRIAAAAARG